MAAYLRPRRGTASGSTIVLKEGEIFLDTAKSSSATTLSSWGQIYVGNNSNNINALKPFVSLPENMVVSNFDTATKTIDDIVGGQPLKTLFKAIKDVLTSHSISITSLRNYKLDVLDAVAKNTFSIERYSTTADINATLGIQAGNGKWGTIAPTSEWTSNVTFRLPTLSGTATEEVIATREYLNSKYVKNASSGADTSTPIYYTGGLSAIQAVSGSTAYRLQLSSSGAITKYKSTNSGTSWSNEGEYANNKIRVTGSQNTYAWGNTSPGYLQWYFYEGADTSTFLLPVAHCIVVVWKYNSARGVAFAYQWNSTATNIWKNNLHDTWQGWKVIK